MKKICFVCLGNICRSPMAEFIMKDLLIKNNLIDDFLVESRATSYEEYGNSIYPKAKDKLIEKGIAFNHQKKATPLVKDDYKKYDYIIAMEDRNIKDISYIFGESMAKVYRLLDFSNNPRDISDPWYTNDFEKAYQDILEGCLFFLAFLTKNN